MGARKQRAAGIAAALAIGTAAVAGLGAGGAAADCTTGGTGCLPGSGYTGDVAWDCGSIDVVTRCHADGTTLPSGAATRTWGWGSASYLGAGTVYLCVYGATHFFACGNNIARGCFSATCNAQRTVSFPLWVDHAGAGNRTIFGSGRW